MPAQLLDGNQLAKKIRLEIATRTALLIAKGKKTRSRGITRRGRSC